MRITSMGQVTVPAEIRRQVGLLPNTEVEFVVEVYRANPSAGSPWADVKARILQGR